MSESFNIYLDESCHLEHDGIPVMVLGAVWCPTEKVPGISRRIQEIKAEHNLSPECEIKWTKVSPSKLPFFREVLDYFFDDDDLHFRAVLIPNKGLLDHGRHQQDHDQWYYKMCFTLLEPIIDPRERYHIYLDIKDTRGEPKRRKLEEVLRNSRYDSAGKIIQRVQQIRSHESPVLQLTDLLAGAVGYHARGLTTSTSKQQLIQRIERRTGRRLGQTTWLRESKFNLLRWQAAGGE